ncbi:class I SAM-dependent methyltransferase [Lentzea sp. NPDC055074]
MTNSAQQIVRLARQVEQDDSTAASVRADLGLYLGLLANADDQPHLFALLHLLAHFPSERDAVLEVASGLDLDPDDLTRLDRSLAAFDPSDPALGRVWPSPAAWDLDVEAQAHDRRWMDALPAGRVAEMWAADTLSLLAYSGAKAWWAAENGWSPRPAEVPDVAIAGPPPVDLFGGHGALFRCPTCRSRLTASARCVGCERTFGLAGGSLDLSEGAGDRNADVVRNVALRYDEGLRPAFLRLMGTNWGNEVTLSDEDDYLRAHVHPVDGPVLDLGAGTGRWSAVIAGSVGAGEVIGVDLSVPMLTRMRALAPSIASIRANAMSLPFADDSVGAVNCWNTLQAVPDPAKMIAEASRVLRTGGTFTMMTFRPSQDPEYRRYQQGARGVVLFDPAEVRDWLTDAGMAVLDSSGAGTFLFVTARRR